MTSAREYALERTLKLARRFIADYVAEDASPSMPELKLVTLAQIDIVLTPPACKACGGKGIVRDASPPNIEPFPVVPCPHCGGRR